MDAEGCQRVRQCLRRHCPRGDRQAFLFLKQRLSSLLLPEVINVPLLPPLASAVVSEGMRRGCQRLGQCSRRQRLVLATLSFPDGPAHRLPAVL